MLNRKFLVIFTAIILVALVSQLTISCAAGEIKGTKPDKIVLHMITDLSGPYASMSAVTVQGYSDAMEWYNKEKGGVQGVPLALVYRDTGNKLDQTMAGFSTFMESSPRPIMVITQVSQDAEALKIRCVENKVVDHTMGGTSKALYPVDYTICIKTGYPDEFAGFIDWVSNDWAKKTGKTPKVAMLSWDTSFGRAALTPETRKYAADHGVAIVAEEYFPMTTTDLTTQWTKIKNTTDANWIHTQTITIGLAAVVKAGKAIGQLPDDPFAPTGIHVCATTPGIDEQNVAIAPAAFTGMVAPRCMSSWSETNVPGIKFLQDWVTAKKLDLKKVKTESYMVCWVNVGIVAEALNRAISAKGWDALKDGSALRDEMLKTKNYSEPGNIMPVTLTPQKPEPVKARIMKVTSDTQILPITDWLTLPDMQPK